MQGKLTIFVAMCVTAATGASVAAGSGAGSVGRTITATALAAGITFVDADHSGKSSLGDYEIGLTRYVDKAGKAMGRGTVMCTQTNAAGTQYQCSGVAHFSGGDLMTAGLFSPLAKSFALAVTGGTGTYSGAAGTLATTWLAKDFSKSRAVFSLDR